MQSYPIFKLEKSKKEKYPIYSKLIYLPGKIEKIEKKGEIIHMPKDYIIQESEEYVDYCYMVKTGRVVSYETYVNGNERIFHFYEKGSLLLEDNVLFDRISLTCYRTLQETELIRLDKETLKSIIIEDPQIGLDILEASSAKFQSAMMQMKQEKNYSVTWKLCDLLLSFADYSGVPHGKKILITERLSQQMISDMLGSNRITVVRAMKELKKAGIIEKMKNNYCVTSMVKLKEYKEALT